jgi:hypothetical protein
VLPSRDDAHGYVGQALKVLVLPIAAITVAHAWSPDVLRHLAPIDALQTPAWRVGIDENHATALVCSVARRRLAQPDL